MRMIGWEDVWKVVVAIAPMYAALMLGYGSVRWWRIFTPQQCEAINHLVCYFTYPLFMFEFAANLDPSLMNYLFMGADVVSKVIIAVVLACWAKFSGKGAYCWSITTFSLTTLTNSLVVGVPLLKAMYGPMAVDLVVQSSIFQSLVWLTILLFVMEVRRTRKRCCDEDATDVENQSDGNLSLMKQVGIKMAKNPNSWHFGMPSIMEGSIVMMSRAGIGTTMFSMGLFMALQERVIACGASLTIFGMALKFIAGPLAMALASAAVGLHGDVLRLAIIQAALPQSITSFIFAKEYELHADVLNTAVIFGMLVSLPVLIGYYAILEYVH